MKSKLLVIITDLILVVGLVLCLVSDKEISQSLAWQSQHCVICAVWFVVTTLHVSQHWTLIKAFAISTVRRKNILTTITIGVFVGMFLSVAVLAMAISHMAIYIHNIVAHVFMVVIIAHVIVKSKRLLLMIRGAKWR